MSAFRLLGKGMVRWYILAIAAMGLLAAVVLSPSLAFTQSPPPPRLS